MIRMGPSSWGGGAEVGVLYEYRKEDIARLGHCAVPKVGDLLLCVAHTGDCFYNYLIIKNRRGEFYAPGKEVCGYALGKKIKPLTKRQFHLLLAGETIPQ